MITKTVNSILTKAQTDERFAVSLQTDLQGTVSSYKLSRDELSAVKSGLTKLITTGVVIDNGSGMRKK